MGLGDTCYPKFVPSAMHEFELHLYIYYFNGLSPSPRIQVDIVKDSHEEQEF